MSRRSQLTRMRRPGDRGFSLIELMVTLIVLSVVMMGLMLVLQGSAVSRTETMNGIDARQKASAAMELIAQDLRGAGSGADVGYTTPQPAIAYVDSLEMILSGDFSGSYTAPTDTLAYIPSGTPKPIRLTSTSWTPPIKYRTGAELIRWTLDVNNDGAVNSDDIDDPNNGVDVKRTRNPNDYMLVRQVYGDSLNGVAGDNGGAISRIAPVLRPGGGVPMLFTIMMRNGTTWDWSSGAVPATQLQNIARVRVQVTGESARTDASGRYARVTLNTTVNVARVAR